MSHKKFTGVEHKGKEIVVPTAGFRSIKAAINARTSKKNLKNTKVKEFPATPAGRKAATAHAKKLSAKTDKIRRRNSSMGRNK